MLQKSYLHGACSIPLLGETIGENLRNTAKKFPGNDALISVQQNYRASYAALRRQVEEVSRAFLGIGVKKGDRVGIWCPNRFEWVLIQYATATIGAILVNINPAYRSAELSYVLNDAGVSVLVSAKSFKGNDYQAMIKEAKQTNTGIREVIFLDQQWEDFIAKAGLVSPEELETVENSLQFDDPVNIQYTSGTTGFPKGVTLSHFNLLNNGYFVARRLQYAETDRVCIPVPFYHCFGMVIGNLACTSHGSCVVIPSESFEPLKALEAVQQERCTSLYGVPTMFIAELALPEFQQFDLTSLRTGVMAGSPCPVEVMKQVQSKMHMREVEICYGMTETSPVSTQTDIGTPFEKQVGTVGTIQDHLEIKIIDPENGAIQDRGVPGELCTRGYAVMLRYWNNAKATAEAIDDAGWMHTGDLATVDEDGYVNIVGRIKDMICRGGENVYPREIEEFLYTHEAIADVQVIGVPDKKFGEEVMAWVKLKAGKTVAVEELEAYCKTQIAYFKIPKYWKFVDGFPMTVTGKIRKVAMREASIIELGLQEAAQIKTS
jgi:fatty-acyl-CoA synthase